MAENSPFQVSSEAIKTYRDEGATCVRGAFSAAWVNRLLRAYDEVVETLNPDQRSSKPAGSISRDNPDGYPPVTYTWDADGNARLKNVVWFHQACENWLKDSPAADIVGQVIGAKTLQFYWDQFFTKFGNAEGGVTPWHHDIAAFSFYGMMLPSFWIALTDIDETNAPLITAAGSHKRTHVMYRPLAGVDHIPLPEGYAERSEMMDWIETNQDCVRTWTVKAGDALLIHPYTYHASLPRAVGAGRRVAYTSRWLGEDVIWNKREMTFDYPDDRRFDSVVQGEPPPTEAFPIVWSKPLQENAVRRSHDQ